MTSFRQIEANRRNALKSTGPSTEEGKYRSRQNAVRHGLCASDFGWAHSCLPTKNTLTANDARLVEEAFQSKLIAIGTADAVEVSPLPPPPSQHAPPLGIPPLVEKRSKAIDKSLLAFPETRRQRDKIHLRFVAKQPCLICARQPCDAHHLRFAQPRGLGLKVSDEFTVPLCRGHHRELHRAGNEARWWAATGFDAISIARKLWTETHPVRASVSVTGADRATADPPTAKTGFLRRPQRSVPTTDDETKPIEIPRKQHDIDQTN